MNHPRKSRRKLWGAHRRPHTRNQTLTIVWNYTRTTVQSWYDKATAGIVGPDAGEGIVANNNYQNLLTYWRDWLFGTTAATTPSSSRRRTSSNAGDRSSSSDVPSDTAASSSVTAATTTSSPAVEMQKLSLPKQPSDVTSPENNYVDVEEQKETSTTQTPHNDGGEIPQMQPPSTREGNTSASNGGQVVIAID